MNDKAIKALYKELQKQGVGYEPRLDVLYTDDIWLNIAQAIATDKDLQRLIEQATGMVMVDRENCFECDEVRRCPQYPKSEATPCLKEAGNE